MSNLAEKIYKKQHQEQSVKIKTSHRSIGISKGEKILVTLLGIGICFGGISLISNNVSLYKVNKETVKLENQVKDHQKTNKELKVQVAELSTYDRLAAKAKELGLTIDPNNIKILD